MVLSLSFLLSFLVGGDDRGVDLPFLWRSLFLVLRGKRMKRENENQKKR